MKYLEQTVEKSNYLDPQWHQVLILKNSTHHYLREALVLLQRAL